MRPNTYLFIGISALLHIIVLAVLSDSDSVFDIKEQGRSSLSVIITPANNIIKSNKIAENYKQTENNETKKYKRLTKNKVLTSQNSLPALAKKNTNTKAQSVPQTSLIKSPKPVNTTNKPEIKSNSIDNQKIESIIKAELSKHFYYPKSAQRKNWQGLVILSFTILPTGTIDLIQINKSSGFSLLDNAAVDALVQIKRKKDLSLALNGKTLNQLLPVNYKLTY